MVGRTGVGMFSVVHVFAVLLAAHGQQTNTATQDEENPHTVTRREADNLSIVDDVTTVFVYAPDFRKKETEDLRMRKPAEPVIPCPRDGSKNCVAMYRDMKTPEYVPRFDVPKEGYPVEEFWNGKEDEEAGDGAPLGWLEYMWPADLLVKLTRENSNDGLMELPSRAEMDRHSAKVDLYADHTHDQHQESSKDKKMKTYRKLFYNDTHLIFPLPFDQDLLYQWRDRLLSQHSAGVLNLVGSQQVPVSLMATEEPGAMFVGKMHKLVDDDENFVSPSVSSSSIASSGQSFRDTASFREAKGKIETYSSGERRLAKTNKMRETQAASNILYQLQSKFLLQVVGSYRVSAANETDTWKQEFHIKTNMNNDIRNNIKTNTSSGSFVENFLRSKSSERVRKKLFEQGSHLKYALEDGISCFHTTNKDMPTVWTGGRKFAVWDLRQTASWRNLAVHTITPRKLLRMYRLQTKMLMPHTMPSNTSMFSSADDVNNRNQFRVGARLVMRIYTAAIIDRSQDVENKIALPPKFYNSDSIVVPEQGRGAHGLHPSQGIWVMPEHPRGDARGNEYLKPNSVANRLYKALTSIPVDFSSASPVQFISGEERYCTPEKWGRFMKQQTAFFDGAVEEIKMRNDENSEQSSLSTTGAPSPHGSPWAMTAQSGIKDWMRKRWDAVSEGLLLANKMKVLTQAALCLAESSFLQAFRPEFAGTYGVDIETAGTLIHLFQESGPEIAQLYMHKKWGQAQVFNLTLQHAPLEEYRNAPLIRLFNYGNENQNGEDVGNKKMESSFSKKSLLEAFGFTTTSSSSSTRQEDVDQPQDEEGEKNGNNLVVGYAKDFLNSAKSSVKETFRSKKVLLWNKLPIVVEAEEPHLCRSVVVVNGKATAEETSTLSVFSKFTGVVKDRALRLFETVSKGGEEALSTEKDEGCIVLGKDQALFVAVNTPMLLTGAENNATEEPTANEDWNGGKRRASTSSSTKKIANGWGRGLQQESSHGCVLTRTSLRVQVDSLFGAEERNFDTALLRTLWEGFGLHELVGPSQGWQETLWNKGIAEHASSVSYLDFLELSSDCALANNPYLQRYLCAYHEYKKSSAVHIAHENKHHQLLFFLGGLLDGSGSSVTTTSEDVEVTSLRSQIRIILHYNFLLDRLVKSAGSDPAVLPSMWRTLLVDVSDNDSSSITSRSAALEAEEIAFVSSLGGRVSTSSSGTKKDVPDFLTEEGVKRLLNAYAVESFRQFEGAPGIGLLAVEAAESGTFMIYDKNDAGTAHRNMNTGGNDGATRKAMTGEQILEVELASTSQALKNFASFFAMESAERTGAENFWSALLSSAPLIPAVQCPTSSDVTVANMALTFHVHHMLRIAAERSGFVLPFSFKPNNMLKADAAASTAPSSNEQAFSSGNLLSKLAKQASAEVSRIGTYDGTTSTTTSVLKTEDTAPYTQSSIRLVVVQSSALGGNSNSVWTRKLSVDDLVLSHDRRGADVSALEVEENAGAASRGACMSSELLPEGIEICAEVAAQEKTVESTATATGAMTTSTRTEARGLLQPLLSGDSNSKFRRALLQNDGGSTTGSGVLPVHIGLQGAGERTEPVLVELGARTSSAGNILVGEAPDGNKNNNDNTTYKETDGTELSVPLLIMILTCSSLLIVAGIGIGGGYIVVRREILNSCARKERADAGSSDADDKDHRRPSAPGDCDATTAAGNIARNKMEEDVNIELHEKYEDIDLGAVSPQQVFCVVEKEIEFEMNKWSTKQEHVGSNNKSELGINSSNNYIREMPSLLENKYS